MLKRENLSDKLVDIYAKKIIHNELKSNDIIVETQIAKEWGVSRSPVRDALHILERQKLVDKHKSGSYIVRELTLSYLRNFHDMVTMFYQYSLLKAAKKHTPKELAYLLSLVETVEASVPNQDFDAYVDAITGIGMILLKIADNLLIEEFAQEMQSAQERIQYFAISLCPDHLNETSRHIRQVYEHLAKNDSQKAAEAFSRFLTAITDVFNQAYEANTVSS
ncbi:MAG: GntR family transcriptional regulator [Desulfobacter sp.]|nr:MAG: GntR family transcriptional regulator [Desulfobacter sp.]